MASVHFSNNVFSAESLRSHSSFTTAHSSALAGAIRTIKKLVLDGHPFIADIGSMQTIALQDYEIQRMGEPEAGNDTFVVTMNGEPLIIKQPDGMISINVINDVDHDRVRTQVVRRDAAPAQVDPFAEEILRIFASMDDAPAAAAPVEPAAPAPGRVASLLSRACGSRVVTAWNRLFGN